MKNNADNEQYRDFQRLAGIPWQRFVQEDQGGSKTEHQGAEQEGLVRLLAGCGDDDRTEEQDCKRVLQTAGQVEQARQLQDIVAQDDGRPHRVEPARRGKAQTKIDVQRRRHGDKQETGQEGDREAQPQTDDKDCRGLPANGQPAQSVQGRKAQSGTADAGPLADGKPLGFYDHDPDLVGPAKFVTDPVDSPLP